MPSRKSPAGTFQSTLPVWGATHAYDNTILGATISIHAPRVGSDSIATIKQQDAQISIHAPRVGSDQMLNAGAKFVQKFQSTLPVWGATPRRRFCRMNRNQISIHAPRVGSDINGSVRLVGSPNFNPRSPCGERRGQTDHQYNGRKISIHAPRVGSDSARSTQQEAGQKFQSTLPVWGATCTFSEPGSDIYLISIHAPRVGSDVHCYNQAAGRTDFNPRSPCGERRHCCGVGIGAYHFNPRSPCGERLGDRPMRTLDAISIHAPRVGSDPLPF